jgi:hypothetical protein
LENETEKNEMKRICIPKTLGHLYSERVEKIA